MSYFVALPDGNRVEVPDDVSQEDARAQILRAFPQFNTAEARGRNALERNVLDPIERNYQGLRIGTDFLQSQYPDRFFGKSEEDAAASIVRRQQRLQEIPETARVQESMRQAQAADSVLGAAGAMANLPTVGDIAIGSFGSNLPAAGVGLAANLTPIPGLRQALGVLAGALGFPTEYASSAGDALMKAARDAGVDPSSPEQMRGLIAQINADPARKEEIRNNALTRAGIISSIDAAAGYGVGRVATRGVVGRVGGGAAIDGVGGGVGEAAAGLATEGRINPAEVAAEAIGGGVMGAASNIRRAIPQEEIDRAARAAEDARLLDAARAYNDGREVPQEQLLLNPPDARRFAAEALRGEAIDTDANDIARDRRSRDLMADLPIGTNRDGSDETIDQFDRRLQQRFPELSSLGDMRERVRLGTQLLQQEREEQARLRGVGEQFADLEKRTGTDTLTMVQEALPNLIPRGVREGADGRSVAQSGPITRDEFSRLSANARLQLVERAMTTRQASQPGAPLYTSFDMSSAEGGTSPASRPNAPADTTTARGNYEDTTRPTSPLASEIERQKAPSARDIQRANETQAQSDAIGVRLDRLRAQRQELMGDQTFADLRRRASVGPITPMEAQRLNGFQRKLEGLDTRIQSDMTRADALSRRAGFGSQSASGTSDRPFGGFEPGREEAAAPGQGMPPSGFDYTDPDTGETNFAGFERQPGAVPETQARYLARVAQEKAKADYDAAWQRILDEWEARTRQREEAQRDQADAEAANQRYAESVNDPGKATSDGFWDADDGGFLNNGGKIVELPTQKAAAQWMARNGQGAYWDMVVARANSDAVYLRARPAYAQARAEAAARAKADEKPSGPAGALGRQYSAAQVGLNEPTGAAPAAAQTSPEAAPTKQDARQAAERVLREKLTEIRKRGRQGALAANAAWSAIKSGQFSPEQMVAAIRLAEQFAKTTPNSAVRISFESELKQKDKDGNDIEVQAFIDTIKNGPNGVEAVAQFSLSPIALNLKDLTGRHEAFHLLQALFKGSDPKIDAVLARAFPEGKGLNSIDPTILRKLKTTRRAGGSGSYYTWLQGALKNEKTKEIETRSSEVQAYVFSALVDAKVNGESITGITPAILRFVNFLAAMKQRVGAALRGDGITASGVMERAERGGFGGLTQAQETTGAQASALNTNVLARNPEMERAAQGVKEGTVTREQYEEVVSRLKPVRPYTSVPTPATRDEISTALTSDKVERIGVPSAVLKEGDPVGLRLDIPAYAKHGTWVVSVHEQKPGYAAGTSIGYEPVAAVTNPTFGVVETAALNIATGKPKATIAVMKGDWKPTTPSQASRVAREALDSPEWVQVGMDPTRHSYFYDRKSMEPVVGADEAIQIGPLVLAKNPVFGKKSNYQYSAINPDAARQFSSAQSPLTTDASWLNASAGMTASGSRNRTLTQKILEGVFGAMPNETANLKSVKDVMAVARKAGKRNVVNMATPVADLDRMLKDSNIQTVRNLSHLVEEARMNTGRAELIVEQGGLGFDPVKQTMFFRKDVPSLKQALAKRVSDKDIGEFQKLLIAYRERDLRKAGRKGLSGKTDAEIARVIALAEQQHPLWKDAAADIQKINRAMLDIAVKAGILDAAKAKELGGIFYTPFYRAAEGDATDSAQDVIGPRMTGTLSRPDAFEKAVHENGEVGDNLIGNMLRNYDAIIRSALKNVAAREVSSNLAKLTDGAGKPLAERLTTRKPGDQNVITTKENGKDVLYKINAPDIYVALTGLPKAQRGSLFNAAAGIANIFRIGITSAPSYIWANIWRGKVVAYAQEGLPLWSNTFDGVRQFYKASTSLTSFQAQTGFGGFTVGMGETNVAANFERQLRAANGEKRWSDILPNLVAGIQKFSESAEMADRIKLRDHLIKKGMDERQANFQAYLLAPYSRHGLGGGFLGETMVNLTPLVPFLNAKVQSVNRMIENDYGKRMIRTPLGFKMPADRVLRSLLLTGFSVGMYLMARGTDPEMWDKETPDTLLRYDVGYLPRGEGQEPIRILLPRAFEFGVAFGALPVFALEAIRRENTDDLARAVAQTFVSTYGFSPIPQAAVPLLEVATGYNFFQGRPLENRGQQALPAEDRVNESTSQAARLVSRGIMGTQDALLPPNMRADFSPISVQKLVDGYLGSMGTMLLGAFDSVLAGSGAIPPKPEGIFGDPNSFGGLAGVATNLSGAGRFIRGGEEQVTRALGDFYRMKGDLDQVVRSARDAGAAGDTAKYDSLVERYSQAIGARGSLERAQDGIATLSRQMRMIRDSRDPDLLPAERRERLAELRERRNELAERGAEIARSAGLR